MQTENGEVQFRVLANRAETLLIIPPCKGGSSSVSSKQSCRVADARCISGPAGVTCKERCKAHDRTVLSSWSVIAGRRTLVDCISDVQVRDMHAAVLGNQSQPERNHHKLSLNFPSNVTW